MKIDIDPHQQSSGAEFFYFFSPPSDTFTLTFFTLHFFRGYRKIIDPYAYTLLSIYQY